MVDYTRMTTFIKTKFKKYIQGITIESLKCIKHLFYVVVVLAADVKMYVKYQQQKHI